MKITVTGSVGHISKPLTIHLINAGHTVTVVSSNQEKKNAIESMGAKPAIGSLTDSDFVTSAFVNADLVYCMVPPANYFDQDLDLLSYYDQIGTAYLAAILKTKIKRVVNLSSIGAHLNKGNGILKGVNHVENLLNALPADFSVTHIRPTEFYYNLLSQIPSVMKNGVMAANIGSNVVNAWVSPIDIAAVIAEEIKTAFTGRKIRYVASEELTYNELVSVLGSAIAKPALKWLTLTDNEMVNGLVANGINPEIAAGLAEMYAAINSGLLYEDYLLNKPVKFGNIKMKDFAEDFAAAYSRLESKH